MLFLKRASDLFDQRREEIRREVVAAGISTEDIATQLENADQCSGKYFFVQPRARWSEPWTEWVSGEHVLRPALNHVKENVGSALSKARAALEEANADAPEDVLKETVSCNRKIGQKTGWATTRWSISSRTSRRFRCTMTILSSPTCWARPTNG